MPDLEGPDQHRNSHAAVGVRLRTFLHACRAAPRCNYAFEEEQPPTPGREERRRVSNVVGLT